VAQVVQVAQVVRVAPVVRVAQVVRVAVPLWASVSVSPVVETSKRIVRLASIASDGPRALFVLRGVAGLIRTLACPMSLIVPRGTPSNVMSQTRVCLSGATRVLHVLTRMSVMKVRALVPSRNKDGL
jgi:hypothetical protein